MFKAPANPDMSLGRVTPTSPANTSVPLKLSRPANMKEPLPTESISVTLPVPWKALAPNDTALPLASIVVSPQNQTGELPSPSAAANVPLITWRMELKRSIRFLYASVPSPFFATRVKTSISPSHFASIAVASTLTVKTLPTFVTLNLLSGKIVKWLEYGMTSVVDSEQVKSILLTLPRAHSTKMACWRSSMPQATEETEMISGAAFGTPIVVVTELGRPVPSPSFINGVTVKVYSLPATRSVAAYVYLSVVSPRDGIMPAPTLLPSFNV